MKTKYIIIIGVAFMLIIFAFYAPTYFTRYCSEFENCGQIGDTIGGLMNPFISIAAVLITGLAFYVQYEANEKLSIQFDKNEEDLKINISYEKYKNYIDLILNQIENFTFDNTFREFKGAIAIFFIMNNDYTKTYTVKYKELDEILNFTLKVKNNLLNDDIFINTKNIKMAKNRKEELLEYFRFIYKTKLEYNSIIKLKTNDKIKEDILEKIKQLEF